jgi:hypothetical protein
MKIEIPINYALVNVMLLVLILIINTSLHKPVVMLPSLVFAWGQARSKLGGGVDTFILHHYFVS